VGGLKVCAVRIKAGNNAALYRLHAEIIGGLLSSLLICRSFRGPNMVRVHSQLDWQAI